MKCTWTHNESTKTGVRQGDWTRFIAFRNNYAYKNSNEMKKRIENKYQANQFKLINTEIMGTEATVGYGEKTKISHHK